MKITVHKKSPGSRIIVASNQHPRAMMIATVKYHGDEKFFARKGPTGDCIPPGFR